MCSPWGVEHVPPVALQFSSVCLIRVLSSEAAAFTECHSFLLSYHLKIVHSAHNQQTCDRYRNPYAGKVFHVTDSYATALSEGESPYLRNDRT